MNSYPTLFFKLLLAVLLISLFAQLSIDLPIGETSIPITGQTFAVLLVGYYLGITWGTLAVCLYLLTGLLGLPIFADGKSGLAVLTGGSGGYLIGFIVGALLVAWLRGQINAPIFIKAFGLMALGTLVILIFGVGRLVQLYGLEKGLEYGFYPFWKGAIVKIVLGAIVVWAVDNLKRIR